MANISLNHYRLPTSDDFSGAIAALQRLQETYKLPTSSLASGKVSAAPSMTMTGKGSGGDRERGGVLVKVEVSWRVQ